LTLQGEIAYYGALNSLAQVLLKTTMPGIPDFYQGSELWDLRLVDPDNRGAVNFDERARMLDQLWKQDAAAGRLPLIDELMEHWRDGRIKLFLTSLILNFRRSNRELFLDGAYLPVEAAGPRKENVLAFARNREKSWALTAVPRLVTRLAPAGTAPIGEAVWAGNSIPLPEGAPSEWIHVVTGERIEAQSSKRGKSLSLTEVYKRFPVALLVGAAA
jgi:(1->4)-alpha-D-glucan 1-alpha-D-glucosylmutase